MTHNKMNTYNNSTSRLENPMDGELLSLGKKFVELEELLHKAELAFKASNLQPEFTAEQEKLWLEAVDPIRERMFEVSHDISSLPAWTIAGFKVKAKALNDLVSGETDDIVHLLAGSLCKDLLLTEDRS